MKKKLILISNDDGINANGIKALVQAVKHLGDIIVVAPESARSAMSNAITTLKTMRANFISENENVLPSNSTYNSLANSMPVVLN